VNDNRGQEFDGFLTCTVAVVQQIYIAKPRIRKLWNE